MGQLRVGMHPSGLAFLLLIAAADNSEMVERTDGSSPVPEWLLERSTRESYLTHIRLSFQDVFVKAAEHDAILTKTERKSHLYKDKNLVRFPHKEMNGEQGKVGSRQGRARSSSSTGSGPVLGDKAEKISCTI